MFGLFAELSYAVFDDRRCGQHHHRCTGDIVIDANDANDDGPQARQLQRDASAQ